MAYFWEVFRYFIMYFLSHFLLHLLLGLLLPIYLDISSSILHILWLFFYASLLSSERNSWPDRPTHFFFRCTCHFTYLQSFFLLSTIYSPDLCWFLFITCNCFMLSISQFTYLRIFTMLILNYYSLWPINSTSYVKSIVSVFGLS